MTRDAAPPEFYDRVLEDVRNSQLGGLTGNPYRALWEATAALVPPRSAVVELGCGTGRLAALIALRSRAYLGLDFAPRVIEEACRYAPTLRFAVADLRTFPIPDADVYVAGELLEHVDDDLGLLRRLPAGAIVVLSVPSFDSAAHVRFFPAWGDALRRYEPAIAVDHAERIAHGRHGRFFHLLRGRIRA